MHGGGAKNGTDAGSPRPWDASRYGKLMDPSRAGSAGDQCPRYRAAEAARRLEDMGAQGDSLLRRAKGLLALVTVHVSQH